MKVLKSISILTHKIKYKKIENNNTLIMDKKRYNG